MPSLWTCSLSKLYHFGLIQSHSCKRHLFANKPQIYVFSVDPLQIPERSLFGCLTGISNSVFSETNSWFLVHFPLHCDTHTHHLLLPHLLHACPLVRTKTLVLLDATFGSISKSSWLCFHTLSRLWPLTIPTTTSLLPTTTCSNLLAGLPTSAVAPISVQHISQSDALQIDANHVISLLKVSNDFADHPE